MPNIVVAGAQWGDEGKGKVVDLLTSKVQVVARYNGGHNAGHTVIVGDRKFVLHLIPSGILHPGILCVMGNGMVIDPWAFEKEMAELRAQGVAEALEMALRRRRPKDDLLHHSDRGVQYACELYRSLLSDHGIAASMSRTGNWYDNALAESFFATLKCELVHRLRYRTRSEAKASVFEWIECWYNRRRRHSSLGYLSPEMFEAQLN